MQFSRLNKGSVDIDQRAVLERVDRYAYEYREANRIMRLEGESIIADLGNASFGFGFYSGWKTAKWQPPFDGLEISQADRNRIIENIKAAFVFMGGKVEFDER